MRIDKAGWLSGVTHCPSPNCDVRPDGAIVLLVIHNISLPPGQFGGDAVQRFFMNELPADEHPYYQAIAAIKVSAHFFIRRNGEIIQFVSCSQRAWHAGESCWQGRRRCNDFSVGIELEGTDDLPYADAQYAALRGVTDALRIRYPNIAIAGHHDIAPGRKTDPGYCFDWLRYLVGLA
ncbi:MAG: 1,6-anhydro-N-acetylmuramyl-L-alanine amidase AmpD [Pseudomonadota bacterium]